MKGVIFMPKAIYTAELKLEIVQRYFNEKVSIYSLEKENGISKNGIQKWMDAYLKNGVSGLCTKH